MEWNADLLIEGIGVAISLVFAYFPIVKDWFDKVDGRWKPLLNVGIIAAFALVRLVWLCNADLACMEQQLPEVLKAFFNAIIANVATYAIAVRQFKK